MPLPAFRGLVSVLVVTTAATAAVPLPERIDQAVARHVPNLAHGTAPIADDAEFLRRAWLHLTGTIPSTAEARAFLADPSTTKRVVLIDRLLASPVHARHLAEVLDVWLMERRPDKFVPRAAWIDYLRTAVAANKPWDELAREILQADGADPRTRPAAKFFLDRDAEPHLVTRDVGRLFLGMNLQCCQCHNHPHIDDYHQAHYYGLFAFVSRTSVVQDKRLKLAVLSEKADGEVTFQSVFDKAKVTKSTGPRMPGGPALDEPAVKKGQEYVVAPAAGVHGVPKFSRRALLGPQLARGDLSAFRRNAANRFWSLLMGRGLVHPLDYDHPGNPPSDERLLALLADDLAARKFDVRGFLRDIALSQTYQRSSELPPGAAEPDPEGFLNARLQPLSPEQLARALMQATGLVDAERKALGPKSTEAALEARLAPGVAPFVRAFANPPGTPASFDATLDQALFLANGALVRTWLTPRPGNLVDRLSSLSGEAVAEELYLSVLTRRPTADERHVVADFLARRSDRIAALQDLGWALLASAEFRFNH
jgi:hypothetical protein